MINVATQEQIKYITEEMTEVKKSVSDGKKLVASAITAKNIPTAADATFKTMADNINKIESYPDIRQRHKITASTSTQETNGIPVVGNAFLVDIPEGYNRCNVNIRMYGKSTSTKFHTQAYGMYRGSTYEESIWFDSSSISQNLSLTKKEIDVEKYGDIEIKITGSGNLIGDDIHTVEIKLYHVDDSSDEVIEEVEEELWNDGR